MLNVAAQRQGGQGRGATELSPFRIPRGGEQIQLLAGSEISWVTVTRHGHLSWAGLHP